MKVSDEYLNEIARIEYQQACGREYPWEGVQQWVLNAMRAAMESPFAAGNTTAQGEEE